MAKAAPNQPSTETPVNPGQVWIEKALTGLGKELNVSVESWLWQNESAADQDGMCSLIVVGGHRKKAGRLFSKEEIDLCVSDKSVQQEIKARLTKILTFLGSNH